MAKAWSICGSLVVQVGGRYDCLPSGLHVENQHVDAPYILDFFRDQTGDPRCNNLVTMGEIVLSELLPDLQERRDNMSHWKSLAGTFVIFSIVVGPALYFLLSQLGFPPVILNSPTGGLLLIFLISIAVGLDSVCNDWFKIGAVRSQNAETDQANDKKESE